MVRWRWPIILASAGLVLWLLASVTVLQGFGGWSVKFEGPGVSEIQIPAAGAYRLWHHSSTVIDGRLQVVEDALPAGATVEVRNDRGQRIPIDLQTGNLTWESGSGRRVAVGRVSIPEAGNYIVKLQGFDRPRHFSLREVRFLKHFVRALIFGIPGALLLVGALILTLKIAIQSKSPAT